MPQYQVMFRAEELNNVATLQPMDIDAFEWAFKFTCTKCHEAHDSVVTLSAGETVEKERSESNLLMKCKFCKAPGSVDILRSSLRPYTADDVPEFKTLITLEARGWEPTECVLGEGWKATSLGGAVFDEFSLEDAEWVDYDEASGQPVEIMGIQTQIKRA